MKKDTARRNSPVVTYKIRSGELYSKYEAGEIEFKDAVVKASFDVFCVPLSQVEVKYILSKFPNYVYPEELRGDATSFLVVEIKTGEYKSRRYLTRDQLLTLTNSKSFFVMVSNA